MQPFGIGLGCGEVSSLHSRLNVVPKPRPVRVTVEVVPTVVVGVHDVGAAQCGSVRRGVVPCEVHQQQPTVEVRLTAASAATAVRRGPPRTVPKVRHAASNSSEVLLALARRTDSVPHAPRVERDLRRVHCRGMACARTSFRRGAPPQCMTALRLTGDRSRPKRRSTAGIHQVCIRAAVLGSDVLVEPPYIRHMRASSDRGVNS